MSLPKTVLIYSGGLDSTVLLYMLLNHKHEVKCLSVNYGQRHRKELYHASLICRNLGVQWEEADLSGNSFLFAGSSQTSPNVPVPEGHYAEESMKATVVPNRNMVMLSLATAWAVATKSDNVCYAAHGGDHTIYPDCREEFANGMARVMKLCDWHSVHLLRPFMHISKADIVKLGHNLQVPFAETWSCYKGEDQHCGACGTCVERREAFVLAGVPDPTTYAPDPKAYATVTPYYPPESKE